MTSTLNNYSALIKLWEQSLETRLDPDEKGRINRFQKPDDAVSFSLRSPIV